MTPPANTNTTGSNNNVPRPRRPVVGEVQKQPSLHHDSTPTTTTTATATTTMKKKTHFRGDSIGSTRGAFNPHLFSEASSGILPPEERHQQKHQHKHLHSTSPRKHRKKSSPKKTNQAVQGPLSSNAETMGNMASMAMAGLDQDDMDFLGGNSPLKKRQTKSGKSPPQRQRQSNARKGLDTINNVTETSAPAAPSLSLSSRRSAYAATGMTAAASSSERSLDLHTAVTMAPSPPPFRGGSGSGSMTRLESLTMQYSEGSINNDSNNDNNYASATALDSHLGSSVRTMDSELFGTNIAHQQHPYAVGGSGSGAGTTMLDGIEVSLSGQPHPYHPSSSSSPSTYPSLAAAAPSYFSPASIASSPPIMQQQSGVVPPTSLVPPQHHHQPLVSFATNAAVSTPRTTVMTQQQQQDIANFASMVQADYGTTHNVTSGVAAAGPATAPAAAFPPPPPPPPATSYAAPATTTAGRPPLPQHQLSRTLGSELREDEEEDEDDDDDLYSYQEEDTRTFTERVKHWLDPTDFLLSDVKEYDDDGNPIFDERRRWTLPALLRHCLYNPEYPEFSSLQQFNWAVILGVAMGMYTAVWKNIIERCVDFVWQTVPEHLLHWGFFTDLDGAFPLPNYMWICPAIFGGVLSYIFVILPTKIPGQNEWIQALHARGVQEHTTFWPLWVLSTLGMTSGLSLGPELPLVLTAGMVGSWLGVIARQSMLQARVMNITAASAAVGGFFGFPMAGAMFVLEIPHRMGLQYFEALSPATIASIVAVLVNRMIVNNDVTGYYNYPFLTATLPSHIFTTAIVYGLVGSGIGVIYAESVMFLKHLVHDLFSTHHHNGGHDNHEDSETSDQDTDEGNENDNDDSEERGEAKKKKETNGDFYRRASSDNDDETIPLVVGMDSKPKHKEHNMFERLGALSNKILSLGIKHEPTRAAVAGTLAGLVVGVTCMFVPHVTFWGEAQLQTLIDKRRTPLPVFGEEHKSTKDLTAYGFCLIDSNDANEVAAGFSIGCAALLTTAKIFVTGLSLGTGIIGGHFWGPLFVGCAASHLLTDLANLMQTRLGFGESLATYPCVSILCMMGSTHVVTFRAHMAIMLILTLTISAFDDGESSGSGYTAGDYSAVFPILVISVFVSAMISRPTVFYSAQRSRGDIMALPETLCEPGKAGAPMIIDYYKEESSSASHGHDYDDEYDSFTSSQDFSYQDEEDDIISEGDDSTSTSEDVRRIRNNKDRAEDIEREFEERQVVLSRSGSEASNLAASHRKKNSLTPPIPEPDVPFLPKEEIDGPPVLPSSTAAANHKTVPHGRSMTVVVDHNEHPSIMNSSNRSEEDIAMTTKRLEEMLSKPLEPRFRPPKGARHRRIHSAPGGDFTTSEYEVPTPTSRGSVYSRHRRIGSGGGGVGTMESVRERSNSASSSRAGTPTQVPLMRVNSYGEVLEFQPSLLDQARKRASSMHKRTGSSSSAANKPRSSMTTRGRHSRQGSNASSVGSGSILAAFADVIPSTITGSSTSAAAAAASLSSTSGNAAAVVSSSDMSGALTEDEQDQMYSQMAPGLNKSIWSQLGD